VILAPQAVKHLLEPEEVAAAAAYLLGPNGTAILKAHGLTVLTPKVTGSGVPAELKSSLGG